MNTTNGLCECGCGKPAPIARFNVRGAGHVKGQSMRFIHGHATRGRRWSRKEDAGISVEDRGYTTPCHIWRGSCYPSGYGQTCDGKLAHRVAYEEANGPIPGGLDLDHKCRVRPCINLEHLEPVTREVNIRRRPDPALWVRLTCGQREYILSSGKTHVEVAVELGVSYAHVYGLRRRTAARAATRNNIGFTALTGPCEYLYY